MSSPPGMIVNAQGMTAVGIEFSLINETGQAITVTPILVPVLPTPELDTEFVGGSLSVPPTSLPYNSKDVDPNLVQFLYPAPPGVYNAFVQVDGWTYEVGADLIVEAIGAIIGNPFYVPRRSGYHILSDRPAVDPRWGAEPQACSGGPTWHINAHIGAAPIGCVDRLISRVCGGRRF